MIVLEVQIVQVIDVDGYLIRMGKNIESIFVPRKGDFISDLAFEDEVYEVLRVNIDLESQACSVILATIKSTEDYTTVSQMIEERYGSHNWFRF